MSDLKAETAVAAQRKYFRNKQREHRNRLKSEQVRLLEEIAHLQAQANNLPSTSLVCEDGLLSWKIIASVFKDASRLALARKTHLEDLVASEMSLIQAMFGFLASYRPRPNSAIALSTPLHHYLTLVAHREARIQAKQWLVQQLYYNTERAFHNFPAIDSTDEFYKCTAELADPWINSFESCQAIWPHSFQDIKQMFLDGRCQDILCSQTKMEIERDGNTLLARSVPGAKYPWQEIQGHFHEADRFIVVIRYLNDDEAFEGHEDAEFHEMRWIDIRRLSPTRSLVRIVKHRAMLIAHLRACKSNRNKAMQLDNIDEDASHLFTRHLWAFQQKLERKVQCEMQEPIWL
ncbi:hypothetical protein LEN26_011876 [Aphanomyces euteiches]|nr:hypothetical protein AeMF1_015320 [Aphanomyces euteiches]KAH9118948.1 hypothetical protein LEN26_011876 [Aphanomyces euteiches]KAH9189845.1 hypothetical protein AeNC1_008171 [Aphanomyces euteiches]